MSHVSHISLNEQDPHVSIHRIYPFRVLSKAFLENLPRLPAPRLPEQAKLHKDLSCFAQSVMLLVLSESFRSESRK